MTAAATEKSSTLPEPRSREAEDCDEASITPPRAPNAEQSVKAVTFMCTTSIPARRAASALPPVA